LTARLPNAALAARLLARMLCAEILLMCRLECKELESHFTEAADLRALIAKELEIESEDE